MLSFVSTHLRSEFASSLLFVHRPIRGIGLKVNASAHFTRSLDLDPFPRKAPAYQKGLMYRQLYRLRCSTRHIMANC